MPLFAFLPFAAAASSLVLAVGSVLRKKPSPATWCFFAGMVVLGTDSLFTGISLRATNLSDALRWLTAALIVKSFVPATWLSFSLTYSRGDYRASLGRWVVPLAVFVVLPVGLTIGFRQDLLQVAVSASYDAPLQLRIGPVAKAVNVILLVAIVGVLMNLEQTFRSAIGTMRWRIKFVVLAAAVIFGARLYVRTQAILYSAHDVALTGIESTALLIGCVLLVLAYLRAGFTEIDVYPSRAVLRSSLTVLVVGVYLFVVGVLAQVARAFGGVESFQFEVLVVLAGMSGLTVLLVSDRFRHRTQDLVRRHFSKAQHDSVRIWTEFSRRLADVKDAGGVCAASARFISETFDTLSVSVWVFDEQKDGYRLGASTGLARDLDGDGNAPALRSSAVVAGLRSITAPFDLDEADEPWSREFRSLNSTVFREAGHRWCVPLSADARHVGVIVLGDRVNAARYSLEELAILKCLGDQVTSALLNIRLANEVAQAKELEAFRAMSAFFVHDLKNTAASLELMLQNLPRHFDNPAFREDALRGIGNSARRIDETIARLTALRRGPALTRVEADLNELVNLALDRIDEMPGVVVSREFEPLPTIMADSEEIQSVVTNLVLNGRDALAHGGRIEVRTRNCVRRVVLSVTDNGCGMSRAFVEDSLFRPFQSTKNRGLGIGMFQTRAIVEAHGGTIHVESETGRGTRVDVSLPVVSGQ